MKTNLTNLLSNALIRVTNATNEYDENLYVVEKVTFHYSLNRVSVTTDEGNLMFDTQDFMQLLAVGKVNRYHSNGKRYIYELEDCE